MDQWTELSQASTTSNEHVGTVLWVTRRLLSRPVAQNIVLHLHLLEWFFLPWTLMGMEMAGYPFFSDSIWTPQESDKMHQNSAIWPKIECSSRNRARNLDRAFSFSSILEWNDKKCQIFTRFQHFLTLTYTYGIIFRRKYAKLDIIRKHVA